MLKKFLALVVAFLISPFAPVLLAQCVIPTNGVNVQTVSYPLLANDNGKLVVENCASACTATLPNPPPTAQWRVEIRAGGAGKVTIARNGLTIDTLAQDLTLNTSNSVTIWTDGVNYFTAPGNLPIYYAGGGTAQAQTATLYPGTTALFAGMYVCWTPTAANTTAAPTLAVNGLTAKTIVKVPNATALVANDLITSAVSCAFYDGTNFELQNPQTSSAVVNINICTNFPAPGAYTPTNTAGQVDCLGPGTYTLPSSVTTISSNNVTILAISHATLLQKGSAATGLKLTGNGITINGPVLDDGGFTSTARFVEVTGNDDSVVHCFHQNPGTTSSAFPVVDFTGSATRGLVDDITVLGAQVDPVVSVNSARTASGTVDLTSVRNVRVANFAPSAATGAITFDQLSGSVVTNTTVTHIKIVMTTAGASGILANGQVLVKNASFKGWVFDDIQISQTTTGGTEAVKFFGPAYGSITNLVVDLNGHATSHAAVNLGDFYNFIVSTVVHGGGNEHEVDCVDCENNDFYIVADGIGGGDSGFTGSSSSNPFSNNKISGIFIMSANAVGVTVKGNASGKPANFNQVHDVNVFCNGNASSTGVLFDIGNSATGLGNSLNNAVFHNCGGASSVDWNVNSSAMTQTRISGVYYDSGDTKAFNNSGTSTIFDDNTQTTILTSAYTNATTTFSNVTGLAYVIAASEQVTADCYIPWQGSATTTGPKYQWTGPASPTMVAASAISAVTATTFTQATVTAFSASMANGGTITITTNFDDRLTLTVINGTTAGTVQLQAAANGTGTLTIQAGASCHWR